MSRRTLALDDRLYAYVQNTWGREPEILARLRAETAGMPGAGMQVAPEQGQFMALLVGLMGARRCVEVGTFTGYSALAVALALPDDGRIVACDVNPETTAVARRYWAEAGVEHKIDLRLAPALETLDGLLAQGGAGTVDFAFIDADKENYDNYYERCLELVRPGGLIAIDNVLWGGSVADPTRADSETVAIRNLNEKLGRDGRIGLSLAPIGDGLTLALKQ